MIKLENTKTYGWEAAIRGMRNPMNSWEKSDSLFDFDSYYKSDGARDCGIDTVVAYNILGDEFEDPYTSNAIDSGSIFFTDFALGLSDHKLMMNLAKAGSVDAKYRRMIVVTVDITAPLYWWKEFDTYKVGTVANSCSTMHRIQAKPFELSDFSYEHLMDEDQNENYMLRAQVKYDDCENALFPIDILINTIDMLNKCRTSFNVTKDKRYWWQMIQLLPSSYNQRRTVMLNYEVLAGIYPKRKDHKLDEWHDFCEWIRELPYSEIITLEEETE